MIRFFKGIIVGLGGISPGLSGSVLLIIFGLYRETLEALGSLFRDFRKKLHFLFPLAAGMLLGVLLFSKLIRFLLEQYEMPTRFCFLGLILGTLPMIWREVGQKGMLRRHILLIILSALTGLWFFTANPYALEPITAPTLLHSVLLGIAVAATAIIPGVDPAVFLSTFGLYEMYVNALADVTISILAPMMLGLAAGAMGISFVMSILFKRFYTGTYCVIFGIFLSMIPNMLTPECVLQKDLSSLISLVVMAAGFMISFFLGNLGRKHQK